MMIDIHTHLLPGLDDGAKTLEESIQMCRLSHRDGVKTIVASPHTLNGLYLNDRETNKFLLIEFPSHGVPHGAEAALFQLIKRGVTPIITHPERNFEIGQRPQRFYEMIRTGCLGQVTAMSLTGEFGPKVRQIAEKLTAHCLIHFIASDAHSTNGRPPILSKAVRTAQKIVGEREAIKMVTEFPQAILEGQRPSVSEPIPF
ncbi:MAG: tyrosine-protein phosphatase [Thermodesulfobacteriota bacterium]